MPKATVYSVMTAAAPPVGGWGGYRKIAIVEHDANKKPSRIDARFKCVKRIVRMWPSCYVGMTERAEFQRTLKLAHTICDQLNNGENADE